VNRVKIPHENALAFFPPSVTVGNVTLGPLTLAGAVRLGEIGVDLGRRVPRDLVFPAAWVLADATSPSRLGRDALRRVRQRKDYTSFLSHSRVGLKELHNAVETVLNDAFKTYIKPAASSSGTVHLTPHGIGWPLEYAEFLCGEYGWSWQASIDTPLATVYALYAAYRQRNGGRHGMDYIEREYAKGKGGTRSVASGN